MRVLVGVLLLASACHSPAHSGAGDDATHRGNDSRKADGSVPAPGPSCTGLAATCGPTQTSDCCASAVVPGNATGATDAGEPFYRSYDVAGDGMYSSMGYPATVNDFGLDTYLVTVARFRAFVNAGMGIQANPPAMGAGAHSQIPDSGWDFSYNFQLAATTADLTAALQCESTYQTWTDSPGIDENLPINCITWFEAFAFCIWDGGYLPTEAEWNYAASGGSDQRAYPWSSPPGSLTVDCAHANYAGSAGSAACVPDGANPVGTESPTGDGRFGQADLVGDMEEWMLDWYVSPYPTTTCDNCANLTPAIPRAIRGDGFPAQMVRVGSRDSSTPDTRSFGYGVRCARAP